MLSDPAELDRAIASNLASGLALALSFNSTAGVVAFPLVVVVVVFFFVVVFQQK